MFMLVPSLVLSMTVLSIHGAVRDSAIFGVVHNGAIAVHVDIIIFVASTTAAALLLLL